MLDLPRLVGESDIGSVAKVEVWRKNKIITIEVMLGELPEKNYTKEDKNNQTDFLYLGLSVLPTDNNQGVIIADNDENVDVLVGDVIVEVNREKITTVKSFSELINTIKNTGRTSLLLKIIRDNKSLWIAIKINN